MSDDRANQLIRDYRNGLISLNQAFEELVPLIHDTVVRALRFSCNVVVATDDLQDIYQDVMLSLYKSLKRGGTYKVDGDIKGYAYRIAANRKMDCIANNKGCFYVVLDENTAARCWNEAFDNKIIAETLSDVYPEEFELLVLKYQEELTMEEIAELLRRPVSTIKYMLRTARKKLLKALSEEPADKDQACGM